MTIFKKSLIASMLLVMVTVLLPMAQGAKADVVTDTQVKLENREEMTKFMYTCFLGRNADQSGASFWSADLGPTNDSIKHLYRAFFESGEYKQYTQNMSNRDFVSQWYRCALFRAPDQSGLDFWSTAMDNGRTKQEMFDAFMQSIEFNDYIVPQLVRIAGKLPQTIATSTIVNLKNRSAVISHMYSCLLQRPADQSGLDFWSKELKPNADSVKHIYFAFYVSGEYQEVSHRLSNEQFLSQWYRCALFREIDSAGMNYWLGLMNQGYTREQMFNAFMESIEFNDYIVPQLVKISVKTTLMPRPWNDLSPVMIEPVKVGPVLETDLPKTSEKETLEETQVQPIRINLPIRYSM